MLYELTCDGCGITFLRNNKLEHAKRHLCKECRAEFGKVECARQRAISAGRQSTLTLKEWLVILKRFNYHCAYCGGEYQVLEHIKAISIGGDTSKYNCVPSCRSCNICKDMSWDGKKSHSHLSWTRYRDKLIRKSRVYLRV